MMRKKQREQFYPQDGDVGTVGDFVPGSVALASTLLPLPLTARFHFPEAPAMKPQAGSNHGWECLNWNKHGALFFTYLSYYVFLFFEIVLELHYVD